MIVYKLEKGDKVFGEISKISAVLKNNGGFIDTIADNDDYLLVYTKVLEYQPEYELFGVDPDGEYQAIRELVAQGIDPSTVSSVIRRFLKSKIPEINNDMDLFNEACLNSLDEKEQNEMNRKYGIERKMLDLVYRLSKKD